MKKVIGVIVLVAIIVALVGVNVLLISGRVSAQNQEEKNPVLSLEIENYGTVKIELYPDYAPNTVKNIIALANNGYYDGKVFYGTDDVAVYVGRGADGESVNPKLSDIDKSIVTTTDENGNQTTNKEDYEYAIDGEFINNQFTQNTLKHEKGVVSLVRADYTKQIDSLVDESYNSGNSQFTIVMNNESAKNLNGLYAGFGKVVEGLEIVEQIYSLDVKTDDSEEAASTTSIKAFASAPVITKATVETFDGKYDLPKVHEAFNYNNYLNELMTQYYTSQNQ